MSAKKAELWHSSQNNILIYCSRQTMYIYTTFRHIHFQHLEYFKLIHLYFANWRSNISKINKILTVLSTPTQPETDSNCSRSSSTPNGDINSIDNDKLAFDLPIITLTLNSWLCLMLNTWISIDTVNRSIYNRFQELRNFASLFVELYLGDKYCSSAGKDAKRK